MVKEPFCSRASKARFFENGNKSLYILREVLSERVLWAVNLQEASQSALAALLKPLAELHLPILRHP